MESRWLSCWVLQSARDSIPNLSIPLAVVVPKNRLPPPPVGISLIKTLSEMSLDIDTAALS